MKKKFRFCCKILHGFDFFMSLNSDLYIVPNIKIRKVTKTYKNPIVLELVNIYTYI